MRFEAFFRSFNPHTRVLGIARSVLALSLLGTLVSNEIDLIIKPLGFTNEVLPDLSFIHSLSLFSLFSDHLWLAKSLGVVILLAVISGFYPRYTAIPHAWVALSFANSCHLIDGGDQINGILAMLTVPLCLTDPRRNHFHDSKGRVNIYTSVIAYISLLAAKIQMCFIYFHAGVGKIPVKEWSDGTALYYWFHNNIFGAPSPTLEWMAPILKGNSVVLVTWAVLIFEYVLAAAIIARGRYRFPLMALGIIFHVGIAYIHGLTSFFLTMSAGLIFYLGPVTLKELKVLTNYFNERKLQLTSGG